MADTQGNAKDGRGLAMTPKKALAQAMMYSVKLDSAPAAWAEDAIVLLNDSGFALVPVALVEAAREVSVLAHPSSELPSRYIVHSREIVAVRAALKEADRG